MTRLEANREILKVLGEFFEAQPDQRFNQALANLNLGGVAFDRQGAGYYEESSETLRRAQFAFDEITRASKDFD